MEYKTYMEMACSCAKEAYLCGEVPVGAVIVKNGEVIASARNNREETHDALGHAECIAIRQACDTLGTWRLEDCELYVTLEPCPMCMGAIINSRIKKITYGIKDARAGACGSVINLNNYPFNHKPEIVFDPLPPDEQFVLTDFFKKRR